MKLFYSIMKPVILLIVYSVLLGFIYSSRASIDAAIFAALLPFAILSILISTLWDEGTNMPSSSIAMKKITKPEILFCLMVSVSAVIGILILTALNLFDKISLAITLPTVVLLVLITAAGFQKGAFSSELQPSTGANIFLGLVYACGLLSFLNNQFNWVETAHYRTTFEQTLGLSLSLETNMIISILSTITIFFIVDLVSNFKRRSHLMVTDKLFLQPGFKSAALGILLFYILPLSYFVFSDQKLETTMVVKETYRLSIALSTIPASLMGFFVALLGYRFKSSDIMKVVLFIVFPAVTLPLTFNSIYPSQCQTLKANVMEMYGKYDQALIFLNSALEKDPRNVEAYKSRARVFEITKKNEQAIHDLKRALLLEPKNIDLLSQCVTIYNAEKRHRDLIRLCDRFIEVNPQNSYAYSCRGSAFRRLNEIEKATSDFRKSHELSSKG